MMANRKTDISYVVVVKNNVNKWFLKIEAGLYPTWHHCCGVEN
jgi:hypothetical protein